MPVIKTRWVVVTLLALASHARSHELLVSSRANHSVVVVSGEESWVLASAPELAFPYGMTFGPDNLLYVAEGESGRVVRFDGATGRFVDVFIEDDRLRDAGNIAFGPELGFYVASMSENQILRFDPMTRAFDRVAAEGSGLGGPSSFTFGPDGNLYVASSQTNEILRYDGTTGEPLGAFATAGLAGPGDVNFGPDGHLYVTNAFTGQLLRFDESNGSLLDVFVDDPDLADPLGFTWGPDGGLYVASRSGNVLRRYDGVSGALEEVLDATGASALEAPSFIVFERAVDGIHVERFSTVSVKHGIGVTGATPGGRVAVIVGTPAGETTLRECPGLHLPNISASKAMIRVSDESGSVVLFGLPAEVASEDQISIQAVDLRTCDVSELLELRLP